MLASFVNIVCNIAVQSARYSRVSTHRRRLLPAGSDVHSCTLTGSQAHLFECHTCRTCVVILLILPIRQNASLDDVIEIIALEGWTKLTLFLSTSALHLRTLHFHSTHYPLIEYQAYLPVTPLLRVQPTAFSTWCLARTVVCDCYSPLAVQHLRTSRTDWHDTSKLKPCPTRRISCLRSWERVHMPQYTRCVDRWHLGMTEQPGKGLCVTRQAHLAAHSFTMPHIAIMN